jgi:hypothetical protein
MIVQRWVFVTARISETEMGLAGTGLLPLVKRHTPSIAYGKGQLQVLRNETGSGITNHGETGNTGMFCFALPRDPRAPRGRFNLNIQIEDAINLNNSAAADH